MVDVSQSCCKIGREFQSFIFRADAINVAIGVVLGTALQNVIKSFVDDIVTPPFGLIFAGVDFCNLTIKMHNFVHQDQPPVVIRYGLFIQQILHLLVLGLGLFAFITFLNRLRPAAYQNTQNLAANQSNQPQVLNEPSEEVKLLRDIRNLLAENKNDNVSPLTTTSSVQRPSNLINL